MDFKKVMHEKTEKIDAILFSYMALSDTILKSLPFQIEFIAKEQLNLSSNVEFTCSDMLSS